MTPFWTHDFDLIYFDPLSKPIYPVVIIMTNWTISLFYNKLLAVVYLSAHYSNGSNCSTHSRFLLTSHFLFYVTFNILFQNHILLIPIMLNFCYFTFFLQLFSCLGTPENFCPRAYTAVLYELLLQTGRNLMSQFLK